MGQDEMGVDRKIGILGIVDERCMLLLSTKIFVFYGIPHLGRVC